MAAGAVPAPLIIPIIHLPTHRVKNHIDTRTPVSIQSDSTDVLIFFTLDGSRPEAGQRGSAGGSRKYSKPILLPAGRVSIRAVAVTIDGRQSSIVTKVFYVDQLDSISTMENKEDVLQNLRQVIRHSPAAPVSISTTSVCSEESFILPPVASGSDLLPVCQDSRDMKQLSRTQEHRVQRETDFLRCTRCLGARPSDPLARFCAQCGTVVPALPGQRLPPAEGGQMLVCVTCNCLVPINTVTCLTCEASVGRQMQPQARLALQDHLVCGSCGSGNPAHMSRCLTCESHLQPVGYCGNSAPSVRAADRRAFTCSRCKRLNRSDARFCDWCSTKSAHAASCVACWRCGASGHPYAFYCAACGVFLEGPAPPTSSTKTSHNATWQATPSSNTTPIINVTPPTMNQSTQTVGLYYPSSTEMQRKEQQRVLKVSRQLSTRDHRPPLTAFSPGRGFWRKQLDHVCAHLRSYTQNNASFRALLGEPRLGRVHPSPVSATHYLDKSVSESVELYFLHLTSQTEPLSSVTERFANSSVLSKENTGPNRVSVEDVTNSQLLKELGPDRGRISTIQQLLDQGADPSCCGSDGRHALTVAVVNGHHDVLPVLVQRGADVDQQSGPMKNTALHEAVALGSKGLQSAELLLRYDSPGCFKNTAGQTAYDFAVNSSCGDMVTVLAAQTRRDPN
uniref:Double zinc ribbon and ankyrin repeat domains 1 n=1 Tax=Kryptolebias marmoratus TaxID=37003 RepID=A0A3Q3B098_KRYMA